MEDIFTPTVVVTKRPFEIFGGKNQLNDSLFLNIFFINLAFFSSLTKSKRDNLCGMIFI